MKPMSQMLNQKETKKQQKSVGDLNKNNFLINNGKKKPGIATGNLETITFIKGPQTLLRSC